MIGNRARRWGGIQDKNTVQDIELIGQRTTQLRQDRNSEKVWQSEGQHTVAEHVDGSPMSTSQYLHHFNTNVPGEVNPGIESLDHDLAFDGDTLVLSVLLPLEQQRIKWLM